MSAKGARHRVPCGARHIVGSGRILSTASAEVQSEVAPYLEVEVLRRLSMYARVNTIFGVESKVSAGLAYIEESDRNAVESTDGNRGLTTLVDRNAGVIVAMSYWDDLQRSSEAVLTQARESAAAAAGGELIADSFEVAIADRPGVPAPGAAVRMTRVQLEPARVDAGLAFVRDELLRRLSADSGLCSAELLIDRQSGSGLLVTTWIDQDAADRAGALLDGLPADAAARAGAIFSRSESYVLVRRSETIPLTSRHT
jgi:hypothetical protein